MMASSEVHEVSDVDQSKLTELKQLRASTKGNITRIKTMISKKGTTLSTEELNCRLGILESYFKQFLSVQANIDKMSQGGDAASSDTIATEIEDAFVSTKSKIMSILSKRRSSAADVSLLNTTGSLAVVPRMRREIKLPTFSGKYSEFPKFITLFNKLIIQDETLENCERFLILKEHLGPRPLSAISDFDVTDDNFPKALDRLNECFDKKALMFEEHVTALFDIPKSSQSSAAHLRQVLDSVNGHLSAMMSLGNHKDIVNAMIIHLVMERIDMDSQVKWEESVDYSKLSTWEECSSILSRRCQNLEAREAKTSYVVMKSNEPVKDFKKRKFNKTTLTVEKLSCAVCHKYGHEIPNCQQFKNLTVKERSRAVWRAKFCYICLKSGHLQKDCSAVSCCKCNRSHHELLHRDAVMPSPVQSSDDVPSTSQASRSSVLSVAAEHEVFLATALVLVEDKFGKWHPARAILDSASQVNLMCANFAQKLLLKKTTCKLNASGVGEFTTIFKNQTVAAIKSRVNDFNVTLDFYILPKITGSKPDRWFNISDWNVPKNIQLADPMFNKPGRVDMLLGAEVFFDLLSVGHIQLRDSLPRLQKTLLGWIVAGKSKECLVPVKKVNSMIVNEEDAQEDLNLLVQKFWEMEQITPKSKFLTEEEKECERIFLENISRDACGRFITKIPFKPNVSELGGSYKAAERRLLSLERKLNKEDPSTRAAYNEFMDEYLSLGHMTEVNESDMKNIKYYSPHQHVLRPESTSTKLRVVFDCSSKTDSGLSLNDVMMKGPVIQDDLLSIVLRFRCYKYAITADVTKMYRQAWVTDNDSNYQSILWRSSPEEKLKVYRLRTITYGTTSAPYLATRCLKKLGEDCAAEYPIGSKKISDFYMDDLISGSNDENDLMDIYSQVSAVLGSAKFNLRKWFSNSERFLKSVPAADKEKTLRVNDEEIIKTLGIVWAPKGDTFRYVWPNLEAKKMISKRVVLAELSRLFDPLGLINPVIVKAKILMQDLWILKLNWDESLPMNLHSQWTEFREKLKEVENISVPRYVLAETKSVRVEMHGFADASKRAYGCCIYIRTICEDESVTVHLWSAKSRVAPLKTQSLPRLELLGAELLSKLVIKTKSNFPVTIDGTYLWTDSEIVLDWLSVHPSNWNTFVANRVSTIQEETKDCIWRYVPSKYNPADIISRGAYANELINSLWFVGPDFLKKSHYEWPHNKSRHNKRDSNEERSHKVLTIHSNVKNSSKDSPIPPVLKWMESFSDFEKLQRVVVNILSFRKLTKSVNEKLDDALIRIVYCIQQYYFQEEFALLQRGVELPATSKYKSLSLFIDDKYDVPILRVGGRLKNSDLPYDSKHQILLPNNSEVVRSYIRFLHVKYLHAGPQALMAIMRQRFWVIHARRIIRSVTGSCLQCCKCRPKLCNQIMGDLPRGRVTVSKPFTITGVDFCGPVTTTYKLRGVRTTKSYIAVFMCFSTKAIHMEVVSDLTTKAFIASLKRFVARRGLCKQLFCDNATNFVGARRELVEFKEAFLSQQVQGKISKYCASNSIEFHHIPPRSPHFGGLWEAAVKSAKYHLARILNQSYLTFEELATVVAEIEAVLNSRPLTAMSTDPNDESVLTPGHFLIGGPLVGITEPTTDTKDISHLERWLRLSAVQQHFWKRWSKEYLHELQQKVKWTKNNKNLNKGDLVLVSEDNMPPRQWLIGRVLNVVRDAKGVVRVADVKTKNGEIRRAVHKLAPIPNEG